MNTDLKSLRRLSKSQYEDIGRTVHLLSAIEYELFRTFFASSGAAKEGAIKSSARATFKQRLEQLKKGLEDDEHIASDSLNDTFKKLETALGLRDQFAHGVWVAEGNRLFCKFIKRHKGADGASGVAVQRIEMPPEKFALIHRNLEYTLIELNVIQEIVGNG